MTASATWYIFREPQTGPTHPISSYTRINDVDERYQERPVEGGHGHDDNAAHADPLAAGRARPREHRRHRLGPAHQVAP